MIESRMKATVDSSLNLVGSREHDIAAKQKLKKTARELLAKRESDESAFIRTRFF